MDKPMRLKDIKIPAWLAAAAIYQAASPWQRAAIDAAQEEEVRRIERESLAASVGMTVEEYSQYEIELELALRLRQAAGYLRGAGE